MDRGKQSIIIGIIFIIMALIYIYLKKGVDILSGLLIVISVINIILGIVQQKK